VTPFGELITTPELGTFMGNRGVLHDTEGRIRRPWQVKRWLVCVLKFRGRHRMVMRPGHYTELFFLDEATALAAGHRPCFECRRDRFVDFCIAWRVGNKVPGSQRPRAATIDERLHAERLASDLSKRCFQARLKELPDGVFVRCDAWREHAYLVWNGRLLAWTAAGYTNRIACPKSAEVLVLTPPSTVGAIRGGYVPEIHRSAWTTK